MTSRPVLDAGRIAAVIFDTDGVLTDTAVIHAAAWKEVFDAFLGERARRRGEPFRPFDADAEYLLHVDGKPRADGVRDLLRSRGISPETNVVAALASRKDAAFLAAIHRYGVAPFPAAVALVTGLRRRGVRVAAVSASRNCAEVLRAAGMADLFDVRVGGVEAARLGLPGKPDPALFLEAAWRLGVEPGEAAVVEDSLAGVRAGRRGGFEPVIGVDRRGRGEALRAAGADIVVGDLGELHLIGHRAAPEPPAAP
ncbi:HAD-IA family hydrolase [Streptosporangium sp. NPDC048047]|uniref:HAD family hydrolase n=1 Tax=Streptosporangium sp. NPDC048047 TaxID=3155748 RepID=UPI00342CC130